MKSVYQAPTVEEAERQLAQFEETWSANYLVIARSWRQSWARVVPMFSYPSESKGRGLATEAGAPAALIR